MAVVVVRTKVYSSSIGLADTVSGIARRIEAKAGYKNVSEAVGSEFGLIPSYGSVTFRVYGVPNDPKEAAKAEKAVRNETGIGTFSTKTWQILGTEFFADVVVKSVEDTKVIIQDSAKGFGFGIGFGLLLLGAGYLLVLRGGRA